jgi:hypothetical protein
MTSTSTLPQITNPDIKAQVIRALAQAKDPRTVVASVAREYSVTADQVLELARRYGWPTQKSLAKAATALERIAAGLPPEPESARLPAHLAGRERPPAVAPVAPVKPPQATPPRPQQPKPELKPDLKPEGTDQLLAAGRASAKARTRKLAERIDGLLSDLAAAVEAESAETRARQAAERQRKRLEARRAELVAELEKVDADIKQVAKPQTARSNDLRPRSYAAQVRAWAAEQGIEVAPHGRIAAEVQEAYAKAHTGQVA